MTVPPNAIRFEGFYAVKVGDKFAVTFDPGGHLPQEVTVMLSSEEFELITKQPDKFDEVVVPAMKEQKISTI